MIENLISSINTFAERLEGKAKTLSDPSALQAEIEALGVIRGEALQLQAHLDPANHPNTVVGNGDGDYPSENPELVVVDGSVAPEPDHDAEKEEEIPEKTNAELIAELEAKGIEVPKRANKAELLALLATSEEGGQ